MEVHPPHEPVHTWRDALIHIGLMTVGLFIALMLEGVVEYLHHKELVHQARENILRELQDNHKNAQGDIVYLGQSEDKIKAGLATLRYIQGHRDAKGQKIGFALDMNDLNDAAWRTARDSGALGYMPLNEVQEYASIYGLQESVNSELLQLIKRQAEAFSPMLAEDNDFSKMTDGDFAQMRQAAATNYEDVYVLRQILQELDQQYVENTEQK